VNRDELFKRTKAVLNPDLTRAERALVCGVGSGGARVAEELVRLGTGRVILLDRPEERLEVHNIIRHCLGHSDLGRLKTEALRDRLLDINPECEVVAVGMDIQEDQDQLAALVAGSTQVHICTDNEASKHTVNAVAVRKGVPIFFGGVFDGGCGGEAGRVLPGGACYACIAAFLNRSDRFEGQSKETFDYTSPNTEQKSTAALNLDIAQIALIQARIALFSLLARSDPSQDFQGNYVLFGNRPVEGLFPRMLWSDIWQIPQDPQCMVCGLSSVPEAEADAAAREILRRAVIEA
jgi:hypothetical protein